MLLRRKNLSVGGFNERAMPPNSDSCDGTKVSVFVFVALENQALMKSSTDWCLPAVQYDLKCLRVQVYIVQFVPYNDRYARFS